MFLHEDYFEADSHKEKKIESQRENFSAIESNCFSYKEQNLD